MPPSPTMDSFDGLLPALFSLLSNYYHAHIHGARPYNLPARSPCLDQLIAGGGGGGGSDGEDWKQLQRQPSINTNSCIDDSAPSASPASLESSWCLVPSSGCCRCDEYGGSGQLYAKLLTSKMVEHKVLLSSARLNCAPVITDCQHPRHPSEVDYSASDGDLYQALAGCP